jgi:hypothetical protein
MIFLLQPVVRSGSSLLVAQVSLLKNFDEPSVYVKLRVYGRGASSVDVESICDRTTVRRRRFFVLCENVKRVK